MKRVVYLSRSESDAFLSVYSEAIERVFVANQRIRHIVSIGPGYPFTERPTDNRLRVAIAIRVGESIESFIDIYGQRLTEGLLDLFIAIVFVTCKRGVSSLFVIHTGHNRFKAMSQLSSWWPFVSRGL